MKLKVKIRKWHKWLSLIIGFQILLWTASGLFMAIVPIETVRSEHLAKSIAKPTFTTSSSILAISKLIERHKLEVKKVLLTHVLDIPVYQVWDKSSKSNLFHAHSGALLSPLSKELIEKISMGSYAGKGKLTSIELITKPLIEYRGKYPVWKVDFTQSDELSLYIDPNTGKLTARRSDIWRVFDFLWMLHIMDYDQRDNFNNWLLIIAAIFGVSASLTGLILLFYSFRKKDFIFFKKR